MDDFILGYLWAALTEQCTALDALVIMAGALLGGLTFIGLSTLVTMWRERREDRRIARYMAENQGRKPLECPSDCSTQLMSLNRRKPCK